MQEYKWREFLFGEFLDGGGGAENNQSFSFVVGTGSFTYSEGALCWVFLVTVRGGLRVMRAWQVK